jgi:hypothetical protein
VLAPLPLLFGCEGWPGKNRWMFGCEGWPGKNRAPIAAHVDIDVHISPISSSISGLIIDVLGSCYDADGYDKGQLSGPMALMLWLNLVI